MITGRPLLFAPMNATRVSLIRIYMWKKVCYLVFKSICTYADWKIWCYYWSLPLLLTWEVLSSTASFRYVFFFKKNPKDVPKTTHLSIYPKCVCTIWRFDPFLIIANRQKLTSSLSTCVITTLLPRLTLIFSLILICCANFNYIFYCFIELP